VLAECEELSTRDTLRALASVAGTPRNLPAIAQPFRHKSNRQTYFESPCIKHQRKTELVPCRQCTRAAYGKDYDFEIGEDKHRLEHTRQAHKRKRSRSKVVSVCESPPISTAALRTHRRAHVSPPGPGHSPRAMLICNNTCDICPSIPRKSLGDV
jgi:hypothetical protein